MSRVYIGLLVVSGLCISAIGATFSIIGLAKLFAGASSSVAVMAAALEFSKLVVAGFLYRYWGHINKLMRLYLSLALVTLVGVTSLGIFGYLSEAYQRSSLSMKSQEIKMVDLREENARINTEVSEIQKFVAEVPRSRISKKFELEKAAEPRISALRRRSEEIYNEMHELSQNNLIAQTKVGPLVYVADTFHTQVDTVAKYLIFLFVSVFDPLAVCIVFAWSLAIRLREKYRGNENRIAALAFVTPVDHRFRKSPKSSARKAS